MDQTKWACPADQSEADMLPQKTFRSQRWSVVERGEGEWTDRCARSAQRLVEASITHAPADQLSIRPRDVLALKECTAVQKNNKQT